MKTILLIGSLRSPPPIRLHRTSPCSGGRIKHLEASLRKRLCSKHGLFCHRLRGKSREVGKGEAITRAKRGWPVSRRPQGGRKGFYKGRLLSIKRRRTSPAQRYYITPEGENPQPVREASAGPGQNPWRPGPKARRRHQPSPAKAGVNLREYWKAPLRSRSRPRRKALEPSSPIGACPYGACHIASAST